MINFIKRLFGFKPNVDSLSEAELVAAGVCPNCWGKQEYDNMFSEYVYDKTKSNINFDKSGRKAFIQQFVETNITGIRLKKDGDRMICPTCKSGYKNVRIN